MRLTLHCRPQEERPPYHRYKKGGSVGGVCYLSMGMVVLLMGLVFASVYIYMRVKQTQQRSQGSWKVGHISGHFCVPECKPIAHLCGHKCGSGSQELYLGQRPALHGPGLHTCLYLSVPKGSPLPSPVNLTEPNM